MKLSAEQIPNNETYSNKVFLSPNNFRALAN